MNKKAMLGNIIAGTFMIAIAIAVGFMVLGETKIVEEELGELDMFGLDLDILIMLGIAIAIALPALMIIVSIIKTMSESGIDTSDYNYDEDEEEEEEEEDWDEDEYEEDDYLKKYKAGIKKLKESEEKLREAEKPKPIPKQEEKEFNTSELKGKFEGKNKFD